uniref:Fibroblast growth factor n=1 Tax=Varanus komodoensis TaxID=61221 RepID=A0A8D2LK65_VARKO
MHRGAERAGGVGAQSGVGRAPAEGPCPAKAGDRELPAVPLLLRCRKLLLPCSDSWILLPHLFFPGFLSGLMELKAVKRGIIVIWAPETSRFLCMDHTGHLYTSISLMPACNFRETILQDGYNVYFSESYNLPISLSSRRNLSPDQPLPPFSQFLPLVNMIPLEPESVDDTSQNQEPDVDWGNDLLEQPSFGLS